jgi:hypothetical protein
VRWLLLFAIMACGVPIDSNGPAWHAISTGAVPPRWGQVAVWDRMRDRMVVFGGDGAKQRNDMWALDLAKYEWTEIAQSGPGPRTDLAAVMDVPRDRMIIIGGRVGFATSIDEVWAFSFVASTWAKLPSGPPARHDVPATTDGTKMWVFGGAGAFLQSLDDLWELDLATDTWRQMPDTGVRPSARTSGAFEFIDGSLYAVGGHDATSTKRDAWRYELAAGRWSKLDASGDLIGGAHFGHALDEKCGAIVLSGGDNLDNYDTSFTDELLVRGTARYQTIATSTLPPARDHPSMIFDGVRRRLILYGGGSLGDGVGVLNDAWFLPLGDCP